MAFSTSSVAAVIGLQLQGFSVPVGDEAVIAVGGELGQPWEPGVGFTRRTMSRTGAASASLWKVGVGGLGHIGGTVHPVRNGHCQSVSGIASIEIAAGFCAGGW